MKISKTAIIRKTNINIIMLKISMVMKCNSQNDDVQASSSKKVGAKDREIKLWFRKCSKIKNLQGKAEDT